MTHETLVLEFTHEEMEQIKALAQKYGFDSLLDYARVTLLEDEENDDEDDLDIDPVEGFRQAWNEVMQGETIPFDEFLKSSEIVHEKS